MNPTRLAALCLALVVAGGACASGITGSYAARVEGREIGEREFLRELAQFRDNEAFAAVFSPLARAPRGVVPSELTRAWLSQRIQQAVVDGEVARRRLRVTAEHRRRAREIAVRSFQGPRVFDGFDGWFRERVVERVARLVALEASFVSPVTEAEIRAEYRRARERARSGEGPPVPSFEEVREDIRSYLTDQARERFFDFLSRLLERADVVVNPKYGRFRVEQGRPTLIEPPTRPEPRDGPGGPSGDGEPPGEARAS